jgi:hypothetical protein
MKFREGIATEESWHTLVARLNVGLVASMQNRGQETAKIREGLDALLRVHQRNQKTGKWLLSGNDYRDIADGLLETDSLQLSLTRKQFALAIRYVFETAAIE